MPGSRAEGIGRPGSLQGSRGRPRVLEDGCVVILVHDSVALEDHTVFVFPVSLFLFRVLFNANAEQ
eukprot:11211257-Lingulodinium_polyedra.AAC.1